MLSKKENRQDRRMRAEISARYTLNGMDSNCLLLDISKNGVAMKAHQILLPGDILHIRFSIKKYGDIQAVLLVRYMKGTRVGCQFLDMDDSSRQAVNTFMNHNSGIVEFRERFNSPHTFS